MNKRKDKFFEKLTGEYSFYCIQDIADFISEEILFSDIFKPYKFDMIGVLQLDRNVVTYKIDFQNPLYVISDEYLYYDFCYDIPNQRNEQQLMQWHLNKILNIKNHNYFVELSRPMYHDGNYISYSGTNINNDKDIQQELKDGKIQLISLEFALMDDNDKEDPPDQFNFDPKKVYNYLLMKLEYRFFKNNTLVTQKINIINFPK